MTPDETLQAALVIEPGQDTATAARNRLAITLLLVSTFVVILNETIMGVAIPHLMKDLTITASAAQWLTTAFMLTMAVVIPVTGFLLQRLNTRPVFVLAMTTFSVGTLIAALAPGLPVLVVGRIIQATGTAIMMPLLMTTVMTLVPPETRGKTMGDLSTVISVAPAIGPTLSGLILNMLTWRWMFLLVLPIALASLGLGAKLLPNVTTPKKAPIDVFSVILSAFGFGGLVYGLNQLGEGAATGVGHAGLVPLVVGLVGVSVFVLRQLALQRQDRALLDLRTLKVANFTLAIALLSLSMLSLFGTFVILPFYMQGVLHLDPLKTGLMLLPGGLVMGLLSRPTGQIYDRFGTRVLIVPGTLLVTVTLGLMTTMGEQTPAWGLVSAHIAISIGLALIFTPVFSASLGSLPHELYSHGSALLGTVQQLAGAAGAALFVALMSSSTATLLAHGTPLVTATAGGIRTALMWGAALSVLSAIAAFFVKKPAQQAHKKDSQQ